MNFNFPRSTSQRRTLRSCGYRYLLKYGHGWSGNIQRGSYRFGDVVQLVMNAIIRGEVTTPEQAAELFTRLWAAFQARTDLLWTERQTWKLFADRGPALVRVAFPEIVTAIGGAPAQATLDQRIEFELAEGVRELAIPDYVGPCLAGAWAAGGHAAGALLHSILDFKTSDRAYQETAAEIDEQLTDYQVARDAQAGGRVVEQVGLCVLIYSATPRVQWLLAPRRSDAEVAIFRAGAVAADAQIKREEFVRNDRACYAMGTCEMLPLCYGSQASKRDELLIRDARKAAGTVDVAALDALDA